MNNILFGDEKMGGYYETVAGGAGAGPGFNGRSAVHTHMTNTKITDPEILESRYFEGLQGSQHGGRSGFRWLKTVTISENGCVKSTFQRSSLVSEWIPILFSLSPPALPKKRDPYLLDPFVFSRICFWMKTYLLSKICCKE